MKTGGIAKPGDDRCAPRAVILAYPLCRSLRSTGDVAERSQMNAGIHLEYTTARTVLHLDEMNDDDMNDGARQKSMRDIALTREAGLREERKELSAEVSGHGLAVHSLSLQMPTALMMAENGGRRPGGDQCSTFFQPPS